MNKITALIAITLAIAATSPAVASPRYAEAPPIVVTAPPPEPPLVQLGGFLGAVATAPFVVISGLFDAFARPQPTCFEPDGRLFPCSVPVYSAPPAPTYYAAPTQPYSPPPPQPYTEPYAEPEPTPTYAHPRGPQKGYDLPHEGCYDTAGRYAGENNPDCAGG